MKNKFLLLSFISTSFALDAMQDYVNYKLYSFEEKNIDASNIAAAIGSIRCDSGTLKNINMRDLFLDIKSDLLLENAEIEEKITVRNGKITLSNVKAEEIVVEGSSEVIVNANCSIEKIFKKSDSCKVEYKN